MRVFTVFVCLIVGGLLAVAATGAADIHSLIRQGKLDEAREALDRLTRDSARTGNNQYLRGMLETDGRRSVEFLENALQKSPDENYREAIILRLAQYYTIKGEYQSASAILSARQASGLSAMRLRALADELSGSPNAALARIEGLLKSGGSVEQKQWVAIDQARLLRASGKRRTAGTGLQSLLKSKSSPVLGQALYLLCADAIEAGKIDDAARWYNLLKEECPGAVGLDALVDKLGSMPSPSESDTRAEKATGTFYSVKVGVFSSPENAEQQAGKFRDLKLAVESIRKTVGGKKYSIVYVGRYRSFDDADQAKRDLESKMGEQYQVVAR